MRIALFVFVLSTVASSQEAPDAGAAALVPPQLLRDVQAAYPLELRSAPTDGEVVLTLTVDEQGRVSAATVTSATGEGFAREAVVAAKQLTFEPARLAGVARSVQLQFTYHFTAPPAQTTPAVVTEKRVTLKGLVRSMGNRDAIAGAQVLALDGTSTETDGDGRFELQLKPENTWIYLSSAGFEKSALREDLSKVESLEVEYALKPTRVNPFETVVKTDKERTELRRIELRDAEIREVPGTFGDPFRVVMLLPGVSSVASGIGYPVVRGSSPASTGYYLDGVRIPQLYHVFLGPAVVHPDFLGGLDFFPGGAPVQYGRVLGGVINGKLAEHSDNRWRATAYGDLINAGAYVEMPFEKTGTRISLGGRVSYTGLLIGALATALSPPRSPSIVADFWDYQGRIQQKLWGGTAQLLAFGSNDTFGTKPDSDYQLDTSTQSILFHRIDARYRHSLGVGEALAQFTFGVDTFAFDNRRSLFERVSEGSTGGLNVTGNSTQTTSIVQSSFISKLGWQADLTNRWHVNSGVTWEHIRAGFNQQLVTQLDGFPEMKNRTNEPVAIGNFSSAYADLTYSRSEQFSLTLGLRGDAFALAPNLIRPTGDVRTSANYNVNSALSFRASAGVFHQPPTLLLSLPIVDVASVRSGIQEVVQTSIGGTYLFSNGLQLTADAYLNPMTRILEIPLGDDEARRQEPIDPTRGNPATRIPDAVSKTGLAYGLDLMLRMPVKGRWFGWLTLSLQRSQRSETFLSNPRDADSAVRQANLPYLFDQTLVSNAVLSYRFDNGWSLGGTLHFNTGRPENGQLFSRTQRLDGANRWQPVARDQVDRLPPFFRGDIRVAKTFVFRNFTLEGYLDMLNVTISREVLGYNYGYDGVFDSNGQNNGSPVKTATAVPIVVPNLGLKARF